ncbi:[acyl-carrier-protein] S-malonyltransferase [Ardenticatena maritima]|uniref:Malonyl CoA-acyl carrier protein transacylase n=1 Tax=Ardenticatena maritima TaxID=872965 RepID=A0A0M9UD58_9CHLR|nr:ACP S-malonyltransferase [Ardenticatena maritima]KPL89044.1 hypothetical protein SE16_00340 [Ardenticatena maritima]GAP63660.1 [acyl-carrier-protein] S-malonyltransferase [Ardenticatena maritima]
MQTPVAFVFPGQGAQSVGMGKDFFETYPIARDTFAQADEILGIPLSRLCFEGPKEELDETINTQPALYVTSVAIWRVAMSEGLVPAPLMVAGHSLGEYSALTAAGALPFEAGVQLVRERGRLMKQAGDQNPGAMAAILGLDDETVAAICEKASQPGETVQVANYNCPGQVVISGAKAAIQRAVDLAQAQRARKCVVLDVSIAAHSALMAPIKDEFRRAVEAAPLQTPDVPVVLNLTAQPTTDVDAIRHELIEQLTGSVRWTESVQAMRAAGVQTFIEFGPGGVLSGLIKRIDRQAGRLALASIEDLQQVQA